MRVVLAPGGELIRRTARVLLADRSLDVVGALQLPFRDSKLVAAADLGDFDVLVAERLAGATVEEARARGLTVVTPDRQVEADRQVDAAPTDGVVVDGADLQGLATALGALVVEETGSSARLAWTVPGRPLRRGAAVAFPAPMGTRFGRREGDGVVVPIAGPLAAIRVEAGRAPTVAYAVVDDRRFLAAIALAAAVLTISVERHPAEPRLILETARRCGLEVARLEA